MFKIIIFDWKRTLYNPDNKILIEGAVDLLEYIKGKNTPMVLAGKGGDDMQQEVIRLGLEIYFKETIFAEGEKDPRVFQPFITKDNPKKTLFIGDRVRSELQIGHQLGATTIWVRQNKFATEEPLNKDQEPDHTVTSLKEVLKLLITIN